MGKIFAAVVVVVLAFLGYTWLFDSDIEGAEVPDVQVPTASVDVPEDKTGSEETEATEDEDLDVDVEADVDVEESEGEEPNR